MTKEIPTFIEDSFLGHDLSVANEDTESTSVSRSQKYPGTFKEIKVVRKPNVGLIQEIKRLIGWDLD